MHAMHGEYKSILELNSNSKPEQFDLEYLK